MRRSTVLVLSLQLVFPALASFVSPSVTNKTSFITLTPGFCRRADRRGTLRRWSTRSWPRCVQSWPRRDKRHPELRRKIRKLEERWDIQEQEHKELEGKGKVVNSYRG